VYLVADILQTAIPFLVGTKYDHFVNLSKEDQDEISKQVRSAHFLNGAFWGKVYHLRPVVFQLEQETMYRKKSIGCHLCHISWTMSFALPAGTKLTRLFP